MRRRNFDEGYGPVEPAKKGEICVLWIGIGRVVVHLHGEHIVCAPHMGRELEAESGKPAAVRAQPHAIEKDLRFVICRRKFNELALSFCRRR